jgi:protein SEY1
LAQAG